MKIKCKICKNNLDDKTYYTDFSNISYSKCDNCELIYQSNLYKNNNEKVIEAIYDTSYYEHYSLASDDLTNREIQYGLDKNLICNYFDDNEGKKILDYGCGNGNFLNYFKSQKFGYDINKSIVKKDNINYIIKDEINNQKFDLIMMRGVIEHIKNFDEILKDLFKCVNPNGYFFITATPNTSCYSFKLNKKWFNQNTIGHIYHFNHINLPIFFHNHNFYNIETSFMYSNTPYANIQKDFNKNKSLKINEEISPPAVGNMMSLVFKKMSD